MKLSYLKVLHPIHVPGVGQINSSHASGLTIDNSKFADLTMELSTDGVVLMVNKHLVIIPYANVAYGIAKNK